MSQQPELETCQLLNVDPTCRLVEFCNLVGLSVKTSVKKFSNGHFIILTLFSNEIVVCNKIKFIEDNNSENCVRIMSDLMLEELGILPKEATEDTIQDINQNMRDLVNTSLQMVSENINEEDNKFIRPLLNVTKNLLDSTAEIL